MKGNETKAGNAPAKSNDADVKPRTLEDVEADIKSVEGQRKFLNAAAYPMSWRPVTENIAYVDDRIDKAQGSFEILKGQYNDMPNDYRRDQFLERVVSAERELVAWKETLAGLEQEEALLLRLKELQKEKDNFLRARRYSTFLESLELTSVPLEIGVPDAFEVEIEVFIQADMPTSFRKLFDKAVNDVLSPARSVFKDMTARFDSLERAAEEVGVIGGRPLGQKLDALRAARVSICEGLAVYARVTGEVLVKAMSFDLLTAAEEHNDAVEERAGAAVEAFVARAAGIGIQRDMALLSAKRDPECLAAEAGKVDAKAVEAIWKSLLDQLFERRIEALAMMKEELAKLAR